jgi:16S rRNA G966 N2-methylase RsmD
MLHWVGKRPLDYVTAFPAQLVETFNPTGENTDAQGILLHGDNKDVLAWLLAHDYRGRVNLIYIDPPFDSGADYVRRVQLRGVKSTAKLEGERIAWANRFSTRTSGPTTCTSSSCMNGSCS